MTANDIRPDGPTIQDLRDFVRVCEELDRAGGSLSAPELCLLLGGRERTWLNKWHPKFCEKLGHLPAERLLVLPEARKKGEGVHLTQAGKDFRARAMEFLVGYENLVRSATETPTEIVIGTWQWFSLKVLSRVGPLFRQRLAENGLSPVGLDIREYDSVQMMRDLSVGLLDLAFGGITSKLWGDLGEIPALAVVEPDMRIDMPLVAVAPAGHVWARGNDGPVGREHLADELAYLVRYDLHDWFRDLVPRGASGSRVVVTHYIGVVEAVLASARAGGRPAVGIVPAFGVRSKIGTLLIPDLQVRPLAEGVQVAKLNLWCKTPYRPAPAMQVLEQCIREVADDLWHGPEASAASS